MIRFTILIESEKMTMVEGPRPRARLVWRGAGIEFYVKGPLSGIRYEQAANLAMQKTIEYHIPLVSLRLQKGDGK